MITTIFFEERVYRLVHIQAINSCQSQRQARLRLGRYTYIKEISVYQGRIIFIGSFVRLVVLILTLILYSEQVFSCHLQNGTLVHLEGPTRVIEFLFQLMYR